MTSSFRTSSRRAVCTSTTGDSPVTVTVSAMPPTLISAGMVMVWEPVSSIPSRFTVLKPGSVNVSAYVPARRSMMRYWPEPSVTAERVLSMSAGLDASTVTPGSTAPDASRTVPVTAACANSGTGSSRRTTNARHVVAVRMGQSLLLPSIYVFLGNAFLAELDDADRFDDPVRRRHRQTAVGHHLAQQR